MASIFSDRDEVRCQHYARFASHLDRTHFDMIYWVLFVLVIFMLFAASWRYGRSVDTVDKYAARSPEHKRKMRQCMLVCSIYALISVVAVVMEVFVLMALQFCDGEDLMSLYWSTWTVMQIGSLIAIFGILLAVFHTIHGRKHPPWALALGTPVLVVAGLGHAIQGALHERAKSVRRLSISRHRTRPAGLAIGLSETIQAEDPEKDGQAYSYKAKLLGYTPDGGTILQLSEAASSSRIGPLLSPSAQARIIGTGTNGQVIVALREGKATITVDKKTDSEPAVPASIARRSGSSIMLQEPLTRKTPLPPRSAPSIVVESMPRSSPSPPVAGSASPP